MHLEFSEYKEERKRDWDELRPYFSKDSQHFDSIGADDEIVVLNHKLEVVTEIREMSA
jgi:hypothetical protein